MTEAYSYKGYEPVIGIEVHVELKTKTKAFCSCSAKYGGVPNSKVCPICLGMPGTMPSLNSEAVRLGVTAGLALNCTVSHISRFDRKHYYYPDLPKGYQITQYYSPLCRNGLLSFDIGGKTKNVRIERIHLEEDAGKLIIRNGKTFADYNRCGIPLIEIVTAPDIHSPAEAMAFTEELRRILLFAGISDCKMNEGSLRCDVNISVRPSGSSQLSTRCEIKNINSVNYLGRAVEYELRRQTDLILSGGRVVMETRRFVEDSLITERMRDKEAPEDYRYITEPDLPPIMISEDYTEALLRSMPSLPKDRIVRYTSELGLKHEAADLICCSPESAEYFDRTVSFISTEQAKAAASLFISEVLPRLRAGKPVTRAEWLAETVALYTDGKINIMSARKLISITAENKRAPSLLAAELGMTIIKNREEIRKLISAAAEASPKATADVRRGKAQAMKVIVGTVMKLSAGRADPYSVNEEVKKYFE